MFKNLVLTTMFALSLATAFDAAKGQGFTEMLVLEGDPLNGVAGTFTDLGLVRLNNNGQVAFDGTLTGGSFSRGLFRAESGAPLVTFVRIGDSTSNGTFDNFLISSLNNVGQISFSGDLLGTSGGASDDRGYYIASAGTLTEAAREGKRLGIFPPLPGINDARFTDFDILPLFEGSTLNDAGRMAFVGSVTGCEPVINGCEPTEFEAVFSANSAGQKLIVKERDDAPLAGGGTSRNFDDFTGAPGLVIPTSMINNSGHVVYRASINRSFDEGLYYAKPSLFGTTTQLAIARTGQTLLPGLPGTMNVNSGNSLKLDMNNAGQVVFDARLDLEGQPGNKAIYRWSLAEASVPGAHGLTEIARTGRAIPNINGTIGVPGAFSIQMNEDGEVAFISSINSPESPPVGVLDTGVFRGDGQNLELIARYGQATPDGQLYFDSFINTAISDSGQVAFEAFLHNSVGDSVGEGIFFDDGDTLFEIMRAGQPLAGSTVDKLSFLSEGGMNASGQIAYKAELVDGRLGVFLFTPPVANLAGDFDGDGNVSGSDFLSWQRGRAQHVVGAGSLSDWEENYGTVPEAAALASAVPEPASALLAMVGVAGMHLSRVRRLDPVSPTRC